MTAVQSSELWYPDDDIILECGKTRFRIHLNILTEHSSVFREMAKISYPSELPSVIPLQDSPCDMYHFLKSMYDASYFQSYSFLNLPIITAVLCLSAKYEAVSLRRRAIDILNTAYPCDLRSWSGASAKHILRSSDEEFFFPVCFYAAAKRPLAEILPKLLSLPLARGDIDELCTQFVVGRENLRDAEIQHVLRFLSPSFMRPGCYNRNSDTLRLQLHSPHALFRLAESGQPYQDWCSMNPSTVGTTLGLCDPCCAAIEREISVGLKTIWKDLPGIFGLPDWWTLKKADCWE
ncbi:hypothetical protein NM688_g6502 [Phlebia brevispora]|uniref:Uncharacterized protein n=1 Tax=Phlebia brevispora TaxID=194682 RepID=A0ACC1SFC0_9APHY|nr:hypothetical protein NM688_g6502 [Phlebia brevispora]